MPLWGVQDLRPFWARLSYLEQPRRAKTKVYARQSIRQFRSIDGAFVLNPSPFSIQINLERE